MRVHQVNWVYKGSSLTEKRALLIRYVIKVRTNTLYF